MAHQVFGHNQFLGRFQDRWEAGGFVISRLAPTVPEEQVQEHTHSEAHFVFFLEGLYVSSAAGAPELAHRPTLIYNPPGTRHRDRFRGEGGLFLTVAVSAPALSRFADAVALPDHALVPGHAAQDTAAALARAGGLAAARGDLSLESLCLELLGGTADWCEQFGRRPPAWLWRARELLRDDCGAQLALSDIAAIAGVHPVYLTRAFRQHFGCTPGEYLRRCRLLKAATLLSRSGENLAGIAGACGYFDQAHFSRSFKAAYAVTPRDYRRRHHRRPDEVEVCPVQEASGRIA